jgi:cytochrome oxidase Cu insertion factor (SCO1/SenC/PrrC family)
MLDGMKPGVLALVALLVAVSAVVGDVLLLDVPVMRNGWWMAGLLVLALGVAVVAVIRRFAWFTAGVAAGVLLMTAGDVASHLMKTPKEAPAVVERARFPNATLEAHDGTKVALADAWARGPLVIVLFRGTW